MNSMICHLMRNGVRYAANAGEATQALRAERARHFLLAYMIGSYVTGLFLIEVTFHGRWTLSNPVAWFLVAASPFILPGFTMYAVFTMASHTYITIFSCMGLTTTAIFALLRSKFRQMVAIPGHCVSCGYNLCRSTGDVCPECGTLIDVLWHRWQHALRGQRMRVVLVDRFADGNTRLTADAMRVATTQFLDVLSARGAGVVRVWCSCNPDLPEDSPLQSPQAVIPPSRVPEFLDSAIRSGAWKFADPWNRAGIDAIDGSFTLLLGNDRDIRLNTDDQTLLDAVRSAWVRAGYDVHVSPVERTG